jgi:uncharacterized membrane protein
MFFRALFGLIPIFFLIPKNRMKNFYKTKNIKLHFFRSFFGAIAMAAIFIGLRNLQLAEVTALAFSGPLWVVLFSMFFLSEKIRLKRWIAVGLGFIGVIIISKPGFDNLNFYPLICYEIIYSGKVSLESGKANFIINISEDGWFGDSIGPQQHFSHTIFRAIEEGKNIIRSANNGISAYIDSNGLIISKLESNKKGVIEINNYKTITINIC